MNAAPLIDLGKMLKISIDRGCRLNILRIRRTSLLLRKGGRGQSESEEENDESWDHATSERAILLPSSRGKIPA